MNKKGDIRLILDAIEKIRKNHTLIIVEGKKDERALNELGLTNISILKKGNLFEAIEKIIEKSHRKSKKCIILTDFDKEGKKLYYILKRELVKNGIIINDKLRKLLMKERISHIEGIDTFLKNHT